MAVRTPMICTATGRLGTSRISTHAVANADKARSKAAR
jgi:hypothetical protein